MTSGEGGSDLGSEFIFLEEGDKFLVCCSGINNFFWFLKRKEDSQNSPAVSSMELCFAQALFPWCVRDFGRRQGSVFKNFVAELTNYLNLLLVS